MFTPFRAMLVAATALAGALEAQTFHGPLPYASAADSPFATVSTLVIENFEDHQLNTPGLSATAGFVTSEGFGSAVIDSVDGDDAVLGDGTCIDCDSFYNWDASIGSWFSFNAAVLGTLPTRAGLVWTDGTPASTLHFRAYGPGGALIGELTTPGMGDGSFDGGTAEDRFFGVEFAGGISALRVSTLEGGALEIDHVQFDRPCTGSVQVYCTAKTASIGCVPTISADGCASVGSGAAFTLRATNVISNRVGLCFYGSASAATPFHGGTMCVQAPVRRTPLSFSFGNSTPDCSGRLEFDFNGWIVNGNDPSFVAGSTGFAQFWYRDGQAPFGDGLSDALRFVVFQ